MYRLTVLLVSCFLLVPAAAGQTPAEPALEARLRAALADIERRDPDAFRALQRALEVDPQAARKHLTRHAEYLEALADAQAEHPKKLALLKKQEEHESRVRALVRGINELGDDATHRPDAIAGLRGELSQWFDVRQGLRAYEASRLEVALGEQTAVVEASRNDPDAARRQWQTRITEGGRPAMERRIEHLRRADDVGSLAPAIVRLVMQQDPAAGQALARLADEDPEQFRARIQAVADGNPGLVAQVREAAGKELALQKALRAAVLDAHGLLLPLVGDDGAVQVNPGLDVKLRQALDAVADAELAITRRHLSAVDGQLRRMRELLESRQREREVIIDIQLERFLGEGRRYEW